MEEQLWETCKYAFVSKGNIEKSLLETILHRELRGICIQLKEKYGPNQDLIVKELQNMFGMIEIYGCENLEVIKLNIYDSFKLVKEDKTIARTAYIIVDENVLRSSSIIIAEKVEKRLNGCKLCRFYEKSDS